jgi:hypothetical protein
MASRHILSRRPSCCLENPTFLGKLPGSVEVCGPAVHRVADLAPSGARAVGCFDGGADMCAQLWVSKAQVGGGEGLKLVVVEGRVRLRSGRPVGIVRDIPHAHSNAALAA